VNQQITTTPTAISILVLSSTLPVICAGCEDVGILSRPLLDPRARSDNIDIIATVEDLDHSRKEIYLRTEGEQSLVITYTELTRLKIDGQEAPANRLSRGDIVEIRTRGTPDGRFLADSVRVRESGQSRSTRIEGTVEQVLSDGRVIVLRTSSGRLTRVYLPQDSSKQTEEEFRRLRSGDFVGFEGVFLGESQFELTGGVF
jgi:hypothetical protein